MRFTHFTITQDGRFVGSSAVMEQAVNEAARRAADTGKPVSVIAHIEGGGTREAVFHPNGTNEKIWLIDKGKPLVPTVGQVYANRGGGEFLCLGRMTDMGIVYYNPYGGSSRTAGVFRNVKSGWTFTAKGIIQYADGTIEWDHSTDGRFEAPEKGE